MIEQPASPLVLRLSWGQIEVEGDVRYRDAKVWPGGSREWDWRETGTHHHPGIQPADVEELLQHCTTHVVLSKGHHGRLQVCPETLRLLRDAGVEVEILETEAAVRRYNDMRAVGGLFQPTC